MKSNPSDWLPRERLGRLGGIVRSYESTGSTNDVAASLAREPNADGAVVVAEQQTAGRGRRGHSWFSPAGSGLYVSVILAPATARIDRQRATSLLTIAAGVAIGEGISRATGLQVDIKWPNDLYSSRRKLAGILAEAVEGPGQAPRVVLGYGINVSRDAYPPDLADRATSLETELGRPVSRDSVLVETLAALATRYDDLLAGEFDAILDAWRRRAPSAAGVRVSWETPSGQRQGTTAGIDGDGALLVAVDGATERIVGGELTWAL